jgi:hypothetical protein
LRLIGTRTRQRVAAVPRGLAAKMDRISFLRIWRYLCHNWPYLVLFFFIAVPLWWIAAILMIRSNLYSPFGGPPTSQQLTTFLTFIGGGLATAATLYGALLTSAHNKRERRRLQLEAVLDSLKSLPEGNAKTRVSGVFPAMVLLGQQRVALRVLDLAVENDLLSMDAATWVIDQLLNPGYALDREYGDQVDKYAADEAASLLYKYAEKGRLTQESPPDIWFPSYLFSGGWNRTLSLYSRDFTLRATACTLLSRQWRWWNRSTDGELPNFPTETWIECAKHDFDPTVRSSAALLLDALAFRFPRKPGAGMPRNNLALRDSMESIIAKRRREFAHVPPVYHQLAKKIRNEWF